MVKVEGGTRIASTVEYLVSRGVPVCGHVGLGPQSVNVLGGFKVQGRTPEAADAMVADTQRLGEAGATLVVVECVPRELGARLTRDGGVPTIGIAPAGMCPARCWSNTTRWGATRKACALREELLAGRDGIEAASRPMSPR